MRPPGECETRGCVRVPHNSVNCYRTPVRFGFHAFLRFNLRCINKDCLKCGATAKGAEEVVREETLAEKVSTIESSSLDENKTTRKF
ncbi:hypothetical protein RB195_013658 [Necator americanus]|uniref:Uncharacterized protein n=1 Tax=Necator americanus TaxID=51031 RepID=A0ABR1DWK0_NECAM